MDILTNAPSDEDLVDIVEAEEERAKQIEDQVAVDAGEAPAAEVPSMPAISDEDIVDIAIEDEQKAQRIETGIAVEQNKAIKPEDQARALRIAEREGLPVDVVRRNLDQFDETPVNVDQMQTDTPSLAKLATTPYGPITQYDIETMGWLERFFRATGQSFESGVEGLEASDIGYKWRGGMATPEDIARLKELRDAQKQNVDYRLGVAGDFLQYPVQSAPATAATVLRSWDEVLIGGATGVAAGAFTGPGAVAGGVTGAGIGARVGIVKGTFEQLAGDAYVDAMFSVDETGKPLDEDTAYAISTFAGGVGAVAELLPFEKALDTMPFLKGVVGKEGARQLVGFAAQNPAVRASLARMGRILKVGGANAFAEVIQEATKLESIIAAGGVTDEDGNVLADQRGERYGEALYGGFAGGTTLGAAGEAVTATVDKVASVRAKRAEAKQQALVELGDKIRTSKVNSISPETVVAHAKQMDADGAAPQMSAPAEALVKLFQSEGLTAEQVQEQFPTLSQALDEAAQTGAEVTLNAETVVKLARLEKFAEITGDIRTSPGELTANEAKQADVEFNQMLESMSEEDVAKAVNASVHKDVMNQLVAAGTDPKVAETQAKLFTSVISNLAERTGMQPDQLLKRYGLTITGDESTDTAAVDPTATMMQTVPGFRVDNPGGSWLAEKQARAEADLAEGGKGIRGADTASVGFRQPITLPVEMLSQLRGVNNEVRIPGNAKFDELAQAVDEQGYTNESPVVVVVNHRGEAFLNEGNTRVAVAKSRNVDRIAATVYWMNGAEQTPGAWSPEQVLPVAQPLAVESETLFQSERIEDKIRNLQSQLEAAGDRDIRTDQVDALVNDDRIPKITLNDLIGKTIFPTIADRTTAGALYRGIDGSKLELAVPLLGGPLFPLRESNIANDVVWANRGDSVTTSKGKKVASGAKYMAVLMGDADMHQSNTTVANAFFATLEAYARDGRVPPENSQKLVDLVRKSSSENEQVQKALETFPGLTNAKALDTYLHKISFEARKRLLDVLGTKKAQDLGAPSMTKILRATRETSMATHRWGDAVLVVEIDESQPFVKLGEQGTTKHPDFPLGIRGKVVGKLKTPINYELLWQDYLAEREQVGKQARIERVTNLLAQAAAAETDEKTQEFLNNASKAAERDPNNRRAFELQRPELKITKELVDRIGDLRPNNIDGFRQARLASDMVNRNWRRSDTAKNKGGVSPQAFLDAVANSDYSATLTQYNLSDVKKGIKAGKWMISQLGDGEIYYALKKGNPGYAEDYGFTHPDVTDNEVTLVSVVNNEQGARGIAGPAILLDAIEKGVTVLDCFGVTTPKFPAGFLPSLYGAFGFEKIGEIPFDPQYYDKNKLADVEAAWSRDGWIKDRDGYPPLVIMKWRGTDADRQGILERYLSSGVESLLSGRAGEHAEAVAEFTGNPSGQAAGAAAGANARGTPRDQGARGGASLASRARDVVGAIAGLNDAELRNLGLTPEQQAQVIKALGQTAAGKAPSPGPSSSGETTLYQSDLSFYDPSLKPLIKDRDVKASAIRTVDQLVQIADGMKSWRDWYARYEQVLVDFLGSPEEAQLFQDILSATSQAASVKANVGLAIKAYDQMKGGQPFDGYLPAVIKNLERIREKQAVQGRKIGQYGEASNGNTDAIAVDRHIAMVIFGVKAPSPRQIEEAKGMIREIAQRLGWAPREVQAALWAGNQILLGTPEEKIGSYDDVLLKKGEPLKQLFRDIQSRNGVVRGTGGSQAPVGAAAGGATEGQTAEGQQRLEQRAQSTTTFARGSISFTPARDKFKITLTGKADLSTFMHESAHYFLEVLQDLVEKGDAPQQIMEDLGVIRRWAGVPMGGKIERVHHEKFARGFEAYLMEGRAPSTDLQSVFNRFRAWLVFIYKKLTALNVELTDEVRGVFDRLVASDREIAEARTNVGWSKPLPKEALYLSDDEYDRYVEAWNKANEAQQREVDAALMLEAAREAQEAWKAERKKVFDEEKAKLAQTRGYRAWKLLSEGEGLQDVRPGWSNIKIDPATVPSEWRRDAAGMTAPATESGLPLEAVAEILGFKSGEEMLSTIAAAKFANRELPRQVQKIMDERHGALDMTALADLAMQAVHSDKTQEVLLTEFRAMASRARIGAAPVGMTKWMAAQAEQRLLGLTRRQLDPTRWRRAELKAATDSAKAAAKGDVTKAAVHKRQQMMAAAMYRATVDAQKRIETIRKKLLPFTKNDRRAQLGKAGDLYLDGIDEILEGIQLKQMSAKSVMKLDRLAKLVEEADKNGEPLVLPDKLRAMLGKKNFADMTLEELEGVHDSVMNIWHLAKTKNELKARAEKRDLENLLTDMEQTALANLGDPKVQESFTKSRMDKAREWVQWGRAQLVKMEFLFGWLDGKPSGGLMHRYIYQPLADANREEFAILKRFNEELFERLRSMPPEQKARWDSKRTFMGRQANGATIIAAALNLGNEGNKQKLLEGYGWNEQRVMAEVNAFMTKEDWDLVQHIWDQIDSLWPKIEATTKAATGLPPDKVVPSPISTPFGTYAGGYYPVVYDPDQVEQAFKNQQKEGDLFTNNFARPTLGDGFTKARVSYAAPILLDLAVISRHLSEVVHYVTHYEAVTQADKITRHPRFQKIVKEHMGPAFYREILPWLQDIARAQDTPGVTQREILSSAMRHLRGGVSIASMGYNIFTGFVQLLGVTTALDAVKPRFWASGVQKAWMSPRAAENWRFAWQNSAELEPLVKQVDRDIAMINDIYMKKTTGRVMDAVVRHAFTHIGYFQLAVNMAAWHGAYEQALSQGLDQKAAIDEADSVVRKTQSSGAIKDLSAIQRGSEATRMVSMFYSWFSVLYNRLEDIARETKSIKDVPKAARRLAVLVFLSAMLEETFSRAYQEIVGSGEDEEDEKGFLLTVGLKGADMVIASVPLLRAFVSVEGATGGFTPEISPVMRVGADYWRMVEGLKDLVAEGELPTKGEIKSTVKTVSVITGKPIFGIYRLAEEFYNSKIFDK